MQKYYKHYYLGLVTIFKQPPSIFRTSPPTHTCMALLPVPGQVEPRWCQLSGQRRMFRHTMRFVDETQAYWGFRSIGLQVSCMIRTVKNKQGNTSYSLLLPSNSERQVKYKQTSYFSCPGTSQQLQIHISLQQN